MTIYLDLGRRFIPREEYRPEDAFEAVAFASESVSWEDVLANRFSIIVSPANAGKTTELREKARQTRDKGGLAIFVALRKVMERGSLEGALEDEDLVALQAWRVAPSNKIMVLVDSLDEALSAQAEELTSLLGRVTQGLGWPNTEVTWVISTRPAVLNQAVRDSLDRVLVRRFSDLYSRPHTTKSSTEAPTYEQAQLAQETLRFYNLRPLRKDQAEKYLREKKGRGDANAILRIAREKGLSGLIGTPGGLEILTYLELPSRAPTSLTDILERVTGALQQQRGSDTRAAYVGNPQENALTEALEKLSSASQLCQLVNVEMPTEVLDVSRDALSARLIAGNLLSEPALKHLLTTGCFLDSGFHQVKVYPDELGPYLAAKRLSPLIMSPEHAQKLMDLLSWEATTGETGVYRRYLALAGWLGTLNPHFRELLLVVDSQALVFFGDMRNSGVPLAVAQEGLRSAIRRIAESGDRLGRGAYTLTSENYWQVGVAGIEPTLQNLFREYGHLYQARRALLRIAGSSGSNCLRADVLAEHANDYGLLLEKSGDLEYVLALNLPVDTPAIARSLPDHPETAEDTTSTIVAQLGWREFTPGQVARVVDAQFARNRGGFYITHEIADALLPDATVQQTYQFARAVIVRIARLRERPGYDQPSRRRLEERYISFAAEVLAALVTKGRESPQLFPRITWCCLVFDRLVTEGYYSSADLVKIRQAVAEYPALRARMLAIRAAAAAGNELNISKIVNGWDSTFPFTSDDIEAAGDATLSAAYKDWIARNERQMREAPAARKKPPRRRPRMDAKSLQALQDNISTLRDGSNRNLLYWTSHWLIGESTHSRWGEVSQEALAEVAGTDVASAVAAGLSNVWRTNPLSFMEDATNQTPWSVTAALQGLHWDLGDGQNLPPLTPEEVRQAIRYAQFEINGFPKWFWPLVAVNEQVAAEELMTVIRNVDAGAVSRAHAYAVLGSIDDGPVAIQRLLRPLAWEALTNQNHSAFLTERLLKSVLGGDEVAPKDFVHLATSRIAGAFLADPHDDAVHQDERRSKGISWAIAWLQRDPSEFFAQLQEWRATQPRMANSLIFSLASHLGRGQGPQLAQIAEHTDQGVNALGILYEWVSAVVKPEDDVEHENVFTPSERDHAQHLRDALIPVLGASKSEAAYSVLSRLRSRESGNAAQYISTVQFGMREEQATRQPLLQQDYAAFELDLLTNITDSVSFSMTVHAEVLAVKRDLERGEFSLRSLFNRGGFESAEGEAPKALEADCQWFLAHELDRTSRTRYSVTLESETPERRRRDILCAMGPFRASIEVKVSTWTVAEYIEALEDQLLGQYMRNQNAKTGLLVIFLQKKRTWIDPASGRTIDFEGLLEILREKARALQMTNRDLFLRIVGIDVTVPADFRVRAQSTTNARRASVKKRAGSATLRSIRASLKSVSKKPAEAAAKKSSRGKAAKTRGQRKSEIAARHAPKRKDAKPAVNAGAKRK